MTNMTYEIAKQLKDAGFPQHWNSRGLGHNFICKDNKTYCTYPSKNRAYVPDLSSLIIMCGEGFGELVRSNNYITKPMWLAYPSKGALNKSDNDCVLDCCVYEIGSTPKEAVAELWLALNKNKDEKEL